jgi:hypothetical protein
MCSLGDSSLRSAPAVERKRGTLSRACRPRVRVVYHPSPTDSGDRGRDDA